MLLWQIDHDTDLQLVSDVRLQCRPYCLLCTADLVSFACKAKAANPYRLPEGLQSAARIFLTSQSDSAARSQCASCRHFSVDTKSDEASATSKHQLLLVSLWSVRTETELMSEIFAD